MTEFWEKYKDPRWQRRRLEVMQLADFKCQQCDSGEKTLNVHHRIYRKGADPWDYANHELQCLCEDCHEQSHKLHRGIKECLAYLDDSAVEAVLGYLRAHIAAEHPDAPLHIQNAEQLSGVADFCTALEGQVDDLLVTGGASNRITGRQLMTLRQANRALLRNATGRDQ